MLKLIFRTIAFTVTYPFRSSFAAGGSIPPDISPEDLEAYLSFVDALAQMPTATDDYRDPPPPWANSEGDK